MVHDLGRSPGKRKMTTHTSILAWEIPWIDEPGRLQSMGSQRVRHDLATKQHTYLLVRVLWYTMTKITGLKIF